MALVAIDGMALRNNGRGVARSMQQLIPLLSSHGGLDYVALVTQEGSRLLGSYPGPRAIVPPMPKSIWEQFGLPWYARKVGAQLIFSRSECAPLWGPRVLLDVPEDPYIRWNLMPATSSREHLRRAYQRLTMSAGIRRAPVILASCHSTADALSARFGRDICTIKIVPLGVDTAVFHGSTRPPSEDCIFHLGSAETRDQSSLVVRAYSEAVKSSPDLPDLFIAGDLGLNITQVKKAVTDANIETRVHLLGWISDEELQHRYSNCAICIQMTSYEGFGLQPLEALACGAPLIVTPDAAVSEVVGDAAVIIDSNPPDAIATTIIELWKRPDWRQQLRTAGPKQAAQFTWPKTAMLVHDALLKITPKEKQVV